ncbi:hypothetical protein [Neolewinella persica]|uniref:hypothetical protein n=1 Tax=Neolewinella persica TaxID=70998 RepID=UPI0003795A9B|nr:hypothetical protein [Neolewinella persica]
MKSTFILRLSLLLKLIFCTAALAACTCELEEWNEATFERYDFIAHVKVFGVDQMNGPFESK